MSRRELIILLVLLHEVREMLRQALASCHLVQLFLDDAGASVEMPAITLAVGACSSASASASINAQCILFFYVFGALDFSSSIAHNRFSFLFVPSSSPIHSWTIHSIHQQHITLL